MSTYKHLLTMVVMFTSHVNGQCKVDQQLRVSVASSTHLKVIWKDAFKDCFNTRNEIRAQLQERKDSSDKSKSTQKLSRFMGTMAIEEGSSKSESVHSQILESTSEPAPTYEQLTNYENLTR